MEYLTKAGRKRLENEVAYIWVEELINLIEDGLQNGQIGYAAPYTYKVG